MRSVMLTVGLNLVITSSAVGITCIVIPEGSGEFPTIQAAVARQ